MLAASPSLFRDLKTVELAADLVVIGGGMAGVCCAVTAARLGMKVVLVHDRPVLGGNASSEVRLWVLGATTHMNSNNRWAREGGLLNELLVENVWRNPEGNPIIWDTVLLEKAISEPNLTLLLNTACFACEKAADNPDRITSVEAFCAQNSTRYVVRAPLFCDSSGDGILGFLAGAAFRMGAEPREEFDEAFARGDDFGHLLGHSIYFYTKDAGRPVTFVPPSYALQDIEQKIPRFRQFKAKEDGCRLWWIEWGGRLDTVHETEAIKWELWRIVYGVWNYIKNSGKFPEAGNLTLEWVGSIPGKRESRRFEGDYMLSQRDIVERRLHDDDVAFGGWSIDLHPADGVYAEVAGSHHLHAKGIYSIPYRCYYSRNVENLFIAGRIISTTHVAFGSTRVMATCALGGQAIAVAAALCKARGAFPREIGRGDALVQLRREILRLGFHLPGVPLDDPADLARHAAVTASSEFYLGSFAADAEPVELNVTRAELLPLAAGPVPVFTVTLDVDQPVELVAELLRPSDSRHHAPDVSIGEMKIPLAAGMRQEVVLKFPAWLTVPSYGFVVLRAASGVRWHTSQQRVTGVLSLFRSHTEKLIPVGGEEFESYRPERRPRGRNFAIRCEPPLRPFRPENVLNGFHRPTNQTNAWVAALDDPAPRLTLTWESPQAVAEIVVGFDVDYDHSLESVLYGNHERAMPFCVRHCRILAEDGGVLHEITDNHHSHLRVSFAVPVNLKMLHIEVLATHGAPAAIMEVRAYGPGGATFPC
jgi:hypothetical protein